MHQKIMKALHIENSTTARLYNLVYPTGFEPATFGVGVQHKHSFFNTYMD